jgi:hypothetical protein
MSTGIRLMLEDLIIKHVFNIICVWIFEYGDKICNWTLKSTWKLWWTLTVLTKYFQSIQIKAHKAILCTVYSAKIYYFHANIPKLSETVHSSLYYPQQIVLIIIKFSKRTKCLKNNLQIYVCSESFISKTGIVHIQLFIFKIRIVINAYVVKN